MTGFDWFNALDFTQAQTNLGYEAHGDWHRDPWGWPEIKFLLDGGKEIVRDYCNLNLANELALLDVPKENWGTRPAVVLNPVDRLVYQALVDTLSVDIAGELSPNAFGWRLPARTPKKGQYSQNKRQWEGYRGHLILLSTLYPVALKTDIVSCFASMPLDVIQAELESRTPSNHPSKRLLEFLGAFDSAPHRSGLPQRSIASALIANMVMMTLDGVLEHHATALPKIMKRGVQYHSFARWMDDMWLFVRDAGRARRAQIELQQAVESVGLNLNAAKTEVLEDGKALEETQEIEHSAVDSALSLKVSDHAPLEELIDRIIDSPEKTSRTTIKFAASRMQEHNSRHRIQELLEASKRMPHATDAFFPLFRDVFVSEGLQDWFLDYAKSDWAGFQWSISYYARMFGKDTEPRRELVEYFEVLVENPSTSLPLLAVAVQRLVEWNPNTARAVIRAAVRKTSNAHAIRILVLAALNAREPGKTAKAWLDPHESNRATLEMLAAQRYKQVAVLAAYRR